MTRISPYQGTNQLMKALLNKTLTPEETFQLQAQQRASAEQVICPTPLSLPRYLTTAYYPQGVIMPRCWPWLTRRYVLGILLVAQMCRLLGLLCLRLRLRLEDHAANHCVRANHAELKRKKQKEINSSYLRSR